ncbi:MAG: hypothetical protein HUJ53_02580, partial [Holdemanella sp.]|nr:hypothetical protein [Holdemanella sp.]
MKDKKKKLQAIAAGLFALAVIGISAVMMMIVSVSTAIVGDSKCSSGITACSSEEGTSWEFENNIEAFWGQSYVSNGNAYTANLPLYRFIREKKGEWKRDPETDLAYYVEGGDRWFAITVGCYYLPHTGKESSYSTGGALLDIYTATNDEGKFEPVRFVIHTDKDIDIHAVVVDCFDKDGIPGNEQKNSFDKSACLIPGQRGMVGLYWVNDGKGTQKSQQEITDAWGNITTMKRLNYNDIEGDVSLNNVATGCGFGAYNGFPVYSQGMYPFYGEKGTCVGMVTAMAVNGLSGKEYNPYIIFNKLEDYGCWISYGLHGYSHCFTTNGRYPEALATFGIAVSTVSPSNRNVIVSELTKGNP